MRAVTLQLDPLGPTTDSRVGLLEDNEAVAVGLLDEVDLSRSDRAEVEIDLLEVVEAVVVAVDEEEVVALVVPEAIQALAALAALVALVDKLRSDRAAVVVVEADPPEGVEAVVAGADEEGAAQVLGPLRNDKPDPVEPRLNHACKHHIRH
jgi:hypothetical protein